MKSTVLVTGVAGFIGSALARRLLKDGFRVFGVDSLDPYYSPALKQQRLDALKADHGDNFTFEKFSITNITEMETFIGQAQPEYVIHLAAQAGVRYALKNPQSYIQNNLIGHFNVIESCRRFRELHPNVLRHVLYASSSSVYGGNDKVPFSEVDDVSYPQSLYAATKRADELMSITYAHVHGMPQTGLRFFTVYGPWGRPDMSPMLFASAILEGKPIPLFNAGDLWRDFTFVDDVVEAIVRLMPHIPDNKPCHSLYNIGNHSPVKMADFVTTLEKHLGRKAVVDPQPWPPTEVYRTFADTDHLFMAAGWRPQTSLDDGLKEFTRWFVPWHGQNHG